MEVETRKLAVVFDEVTIHRRVAEHARQLVERCKMEGVRVLTVLICLKGAATYGVHLGGAMSRLAGAPCLRLEYVYKPSYEGGITTGRVQTKLEVPLDAVLDKRVLVVEDIVDTGQSVASVYQDVMARKPIAPPWITAIVRKPKAQVVAVPELATTPLDIPEFPDGSYPYVLGYGMDGPDGFGRERPDIVYWK